jgi:GrpB-like predicted nucleotidyltransferase (UPF0157 family)
MERSMTNDDDLGQPASAQPQTTEEHLRAIYVVPLVPLNATIYLAEYDPEWPRLFAREAERIRGALGARAALLEHAGSTSVPGLAAKPRIDIVLAVPDSADEPAYLPDLEAAGYTLHIREPEWFQHRVCKGPDTDVNLHIFTERTKRELAARHWAYVQHYADAKGDVVRAILARADRDTAGG